jgi:hypothetical protein
LALLAGFNWLCPGIIFSFSSFELVHLKADQELGQDGWELGLASLGLFICNINK